MNRWEHVAHRSLATQERKSVDNAPIRSLRTRRLAAAGLVVTGLGAAAFVTLGATDDDSQLWPRFASYAALLALLACRLILTSDRRARFMSLRTRYLDEREIATRSAAESNAYQLATIVLLLLAAVGYLGFDRHGERLGEVLTLGALAGVAVFAIGIMPALPAALESLRQPDENESEGEGEGEDQGRDDPDEVEV